MSEINLVMGKVVADAEGRRADAGFQGPMSRELELQVEWFTAGVVFEKSGHVPAAWMTYLKEVQCEADPEYAEYQRLQKKFG